MIFKRHAAGRRAEIGRLDALARYLAEDCCRGRPALCTIPTIAGTVPPPDTGKPAVTEPLDVLFVCTRNAARSQMAESIFTVCDHAASEECARWPGGPVTAHRGMSDPPGAGGGKAALGRALHMAFGALERRFAAFVALPLKSIDRLSLQREVDGIADVDVVRTADAVLRAGADRR